MRAIELYIDYNHVFRYHPVVVRPLSGSGSFLSGAGVSVWRAGMDGWMEWVAFDCCFLFVGGAGEMHGSVERGIVGTGWRGGGRVE